MTTELTKAAQQAHTPEHIAGVDHAHELLRRMGYHRDGDWFIHANRRGAEAIHISTISTIVNAGQMALTQRPAAQTEREAFEAWYVDHCPDLTCEPIGSRLFTLQLEAWQARAFLPAPQQATPDPDDEGPEFTVSDPDLNHLLNLAADMAKGRCNHDTGMAWLQALEAVEARLAATPEPVGEVVYIAKGHLREVLNGNTMNAYLSPEPDRFADVALYTQPAPGVPEGWRDAKNDPPPVGVDVLVAAEFDGPGDWRIKVGGRNPEQRTGWWVFGASWVPQVWMPLDAHRAMLAAAQAKGGE